MQRSNVLFLLLAVIVCAVVVVLVGPGMGGGTEAPPNGGQPVEVPAPGPGAGPQPPGGQQPVAPGAVHVQLTVTALEKFASPAASLTLARRVDGAVLSARILAGSGAGFDREPSRPGIALVAVDLDRAILLRQVAIDPSDPQPTTIGARIVLRGRVVDTSQQPVVGAVVWFGELVDAEPRTTTTDDDGAFELDAPAGSGVPFVVRARGLATAWRTITVAGQSAPLQIILQPAGRLLVQLAARAVGMNEARTFVVPVGQVSTELSRWPFFQQVLGDGYPVDEQGRVQIDDLPQRGRLGVVVRHPLSPLAAPVEVRLDGQSSRVVVPLQFAVTQRRGLVVDDDGNALAGIAIWARRARQSLGTGASQRLLPPHLDARDTCFAFTDAAGAFSIGAPTGEQLLLTLRAAGRAGRDVFWQSHQEEAIVMPAWRGGDASLRLAAPVADEAWSVETNLGGGVRANCPAGEGWRVALPYAGRFDVRVTVSVAGQAKAEKAFLNQFATGPVDITTPSPY